MNTAAAPAPATAAAQEIADWLHQAYGLFYSDAGGALELAERALAALDAHDAAAAAGTPLPWPAADAQGRPSHWLASGPQAMRVRARVRRGVALCNLGRGAEAVAEVEAALAACPVDHPDLRAEAVEAMTVIHEQLGALDEALRWGLEHAEAARALGDAPRLGSARQAVGIIRSRSGDHEGGLIEYRAALATFEAAGEQSHAANAEVNIGIACKNLGRLDEAVRHLERGAAIHATLAHPAGVAIARANLGEPLAGLGRLDEAIEIVSQAAKALDELGLPIAETFARSMLGRLLAERGDADAAGPELERALALAKRTGSANHVAQAHRALSAWHKAARRFEPALVHHEAFHEAERRQINEASQRVQREMAARFDLAQARHDMELQRRHASELAALARTDPLTGLPNRRAFDERLADALAHAARDGQTLTLAICDLDDFKHINDRFGHPVGDAVLQATADLLRSALRASDLVARYGGEEFVAAFPATSPAGAHQACEQFRAALAAHDWHALQPELAVTVSIGIAAITDTGADRTALLREADRRLYDAKRLGKNRVQVG